MRTVILLLTVLMIAVSAFAIEQEWNLAKSTHFIIYYRGNLDDFVEKVVNKAERLYDEIADYLGFRRYDFWLWDNRAKIYIYKDAQEYWQATGQPQWSSGCAFTEEKVIKTHPLARDFLGGVLPHELGHIIFREFIGFDNSNIPLWLDEGVAGYQEKNRRYSASRIIRMAIADKRLMSVNDLEDFNLRGSRDAEAVKLFYAQSISLVDYLIKEFGRDRFAGFCRNLRDRKSILEALRLNYNFDNRRQLEQAWQAYITR